MTIEALISALRDQNVQLAVAGDRLRCIGPREAITPAVQAELARRKAEIIAFLCATQAPAGQIESNRLRGALDALTARQRNHLRAIVDRHTARTQSSKRWIQSCRPFLADYDSSARFRLDTKEMFYRPVATRALGARFWDIDGNEYLDFGMGFGANLFGHSPAFIVEALEEEIKHGMPLGPHWHLVDQVASLICELTGMERVTFLNSGSEAVMGALRIARTVTGRSTVALFAGSNHGWVNSDELRSAPSMPARVAEDVLVLNYGSPEALQAIKAHAHELAAVLVEPVQSCRPDFQPKEFLHALRRLTTEAGVVLIFDEVLAGFRIHPGGAQAWFDVRADLATYGSIVGGGMPIGVIAGASRFMDAVDGGMWNYGDASRPQAATALISGVFSRHPLSIAAALAVLKELKRQGPAIQRGLNQKTDALVQRLNDHFNQTRVPIQVVHFGSLFRFTSQEDILDYLDCQLVEKGIFVGSSRNWFLSTAHSDEDIERLIQAVKESIAELQAGGFLLDSSLPSDTIEQPAAGQEESRETLTLPLTEIQQDYWLAVQLGGEAAHATLEGMFLRLRGPLQVDALRRALQKAVDRHEALRTTFDARGKFQSVAPTLKLDAPLIDFSHLDAAAREAQISEWMIAQSRQPFDLVAGPLIRCHLLKVSPQEHLLCPTASHLVTDAWSFEVLFKELVELYSGECQGRAAQLPAPMQYAEYVHWMESQRTSSKRADDEAFWLTQFSDSIPVLDLPTDRPRPKVMTYAGAREHKRLEASQIDPLRKWSSQHGATLFMTLLTAFGVFLKRLTGQDDFVIGVPTAMRPLRGSENLIGFCINIMPVRIRTAGDPRFSDQLISVRRTLLQCYEHADYPFGALIRNLNPARDPSRLQLVAVTFNLNRRVALPPMGELTAELIPQPISFTQYDFALTIFEANGDLLLNCLYKTDLFERETIQRWMDNLTSLLQSVMVSPDERISALSLLPEVEHRRLLVEWNHTQADYPKAQCVHDLIEAQAERTPNAPAVVQRGDGLTYRDLNRRANQLAHYLQKQGVGPETPVGVCMERSPEMIVALLGVLKAGGAYVPLDPAYPEDRLALMLNDVRARLVLTHDQTVERLPECGAKVINLDRAGRAIARQSRAKPASGATTGNLAYVIYTSGSTGIPKGVQIEHRGLLNLIFWHRRAYDLSPADRTTQLAGAGFDASVWELWPTLTTGACVYLPPDEETRLTPARLQNWLIAEKITISFLPTPLAESILALDWPTGIALRILLTGGDKLHHYPTQPLSFALVNHYGPTESSVVTSATPVPMMPHSEIAPPIGRPIANIQIYLLDPNLQPVPTGAAGELYIGGEGLARGYLGQPAMTAEKFIPNPFSSPSSAGGAEGSRLYRTGDLARYLLDGNVEFLGRIDEQIKIRGLRIELGEIETVLSQYPAVQQVAVLAKDGKHPSDGKHLLAFIVPTAEPELSLDDLRNYLKKKLPHYMLPSSFVLLEALPLTPSGKVDRRALADTQPVQPERSGAVVPPRTPVEQAIADIWTEVLGAETVSVYDDFFERGGHSLLAAQVISRLYETFQVELPLSRLFESATVAGLAEVIVQRQLEEADADALSRLLAEVEQLSPEQAEMALASPPGGRVEKAE